jgi:dUTP pyrophosphatase
MELKILDHRLQVFAPSTELSAGYDLRCCEDEEVVILPGQTIKVKTGISVHMGAIGGEDKMESGHQFHYCGVIMPRSSLGCKGLKPRNVPGLIDADYQGEIILCMHNETDDFVTIQPMDRIAQLVFMLALHPNFMKVTNFSNETSRGENGFGSTGVQ